MKIESDFECLSFDPFYLQENFINNESDVNFYQNQVPNCEQTNFYKLKLKVPE